MRELKAKNPAEEITVWFDEGVYAFTETEVFGPEDSGSVKQKISYRALPGTQVVFSAGAPLAEWEPAIGSFLNEEAQGKVLFADIPAAWAGLVQNGKPWHPYALFDAEGRRLRGHEALASRRWIRPRTRWRIKATSVTSSCSNSIWIGTSFAARKAC